MNWWQAIILGIVQGITEFLPISSDGHLALAQRWLGLPAISLTFDITVHAGTLAAIIWYFRREILAARWPMWSRITIATLPIVILGPFIREAIEGLKYSPVIVTYGFVATAVMLFIADLLMRADAAYWHNKPWWFKGVHRLWQRWRDITAAKVSELPGFLPALEVGCLQVLAVLPGVSRSASTITAGVAGGLSRQTAFSFAFLIGIPAIAGAVFLDGLNVWQSGEWSNHPWSLYFLSAVTAGFVGLVSLRIFELVIKHSRLRFFAFYCLVVALLSVLFV